MNSIKDYIDQHIFGDAGSELVFWNQLDPKVYLKTQMQHDIAQVLAYFNKHDIEENDLVSLILPTEPGFVACLYGSIYFGALPVALYPPARIGRLQAWQEQTAKMIMQVKSKLVITKKALYGLVAQTLKKAGYRCKIVCVEDLLQNQATISNPIFPTPKRKGDDACVVQFSSGTTGNPKPIYISHDNILHNVGAIAKLLPHDNPIGVSWLPLYHDMGLFGTLFLSLLSGSGTLHLLRPEQFISKPLLWLQVMSRTKAYASAAPNFAFGLCNKRIHKEDIEDLDLSHWKLAICGAETVDAMTINKFVEKFADAGFRSETICPAYGMAEATLAVTIASSDEVPSFQQDSNTPAQFACLGKVLSGTKLKICDEYGDELADNQVGRIMISGKGLAKHLADAQGWYDSGDLGYLCDGSLYFVSRSKDILMINGRGIDPSPIEQCVSGLDFVREGCVVCFSFKAPGEDTEKIIIILERDKNIKTNDSSNLEVSVINSVSQMFQLRVSQVHVVNPGVIPRTSSGKLKRQETKKLFQIGRLQDPKNQLQSWAYFAAESLKGHIFGQDRV